MQGVGRITATAAMMIVLATGAQAQGKGKSQFIEGDVTCAQMVKTHDYVSAVLDGRDSGGDPKRVRALFGVYGQILGYIAGYGARFQTERGVRLSVRDSSEALELFYNGCANTPEARLEDMLSSFVADSAPTSAKAAPPPAGGAGLPTCQDKGMRTQIRQFVEQEYRKQGVSPQHESVKGVFTAIDSLNEGASQDAMGFRRAFVTDLGKASPDYVNERLFRVCEARTDAHLSEKEQASSVAVQRRMGINMPNQFMVMLVQNPKAPRDYAAFVIGYLGNNSGQIGGEFLRAVLP